MDDNKVIRQLIRVNLELEGIEVVTAADGAECLDVVHQVRPDVITLDVVMPRLDGLRTAARLRADSATRDLPLAIVSACTQHEIESGLDVGVDAFLAKPFDPDELVRLVRRLIATGRGGAGESGDGGTAAALGGGFGAGGAFGNGSGFESGSGVGLGTGSGLEAGRGLGTGSGRGTGSGLGAGGGSGAGSVG
ncbi:two-component system response regulator [Streptomyces zinciresistens K42]|uniref:Two-component system response regulator n=1 Tax=Streptomyces zinciresistens K42 TaxID=700597 RepID=G2GIA5_9ACTN|nr:two-component system response regulator [Streptomyces zinciresistens K42]